MYFTCDARILWKPASIKIGVNKQDILLTVWILAILVYTCIISMYIMGLNKIDCNQNTMDCLSHLDMQPNWRYQDGKIRIGSLSIMRCTTKNTTRLNNYVKVVRKRAMVCYSVEITLSLHSWYICLHAFAGAHLCRQRYHSCRDRVISTL